MNLAVFVLGEYKSNCYLLYKNYQALIIDPGYNSKRVDKFIKENGLIVEAIYVTHGHIDHIGGVNSLKKRYPKIKVYAPRKDQYWYLKDNSRGLTEDLLVDVYVKQGDYIAFADKIFEVIETPGHSYGSSCLYSDKVLFSGDTLFYHSYGRTDLYLGDIKALRDSIQNKLFKLPHDTIVYPGHGKPTTILEEIIYNPIVRKEKI
ncbi:MAG: MBL fold metallo-hydrolase [Acholeplasmataceae bacterium]|jgi:glyoxylase-like metal-dependent hydrolase (beta-lactamase superfamily II)|nr:MBL fold metallo-hydrolase [Acholeplasmataceae bacterium]